MKALTVKQPWAWAIAYGYKGVENRGRTVSYRGPLAIHAGKSWSKTGANDDRVIAAAVDASEGRPGAALLVLAGAPKVCPQGATVALVDLTDCHQANDCCEPWGDATYGAPDKTAYHLVLENARLLDGPLPCKGALGLWAPPAGLADRPARPVRYGRYLAPST